MSSLGVILLVLLSVAFFSLFERKVLAFIQSRKGPGKVMVQGFTQPFADALKLVLKVETVPSNAAKAVYILSPSFVMFLTLWVWVLYPVEWGMFISTQSVVLVLIYFSFSVYGIIFSGWGSNSRYATIGCVRAISQSISYEIGLSSILVFLMIYNSSFDLLVVMEGQEKSWFFFPLFPLFVVMSICLFAEINRSPFDLAEGESELVSGFNVEYGGSKYTTIFLGENLALLWASSLLSLFFFHKSELLVILFIFLFVWIRATLPRIRYDKMTKLFWVLILPLTLSVGGVLLL